MNGSKALLFFFSALGAFNGLILSTYFLFFTKKKYLSNYFLGALLLALSIRIAKSVLFYFDAQLPKIYLQIGLSACFLIGPFLYYFVKASLAESQVPKRNWKWSLALLIAIVVVAGYLFPYQEYPFLWNVYFAKIIYAQWLLYLLAAAFELKDLFKSLISKSYKLKISEQWLLTIFFGNIIIFIFYFLALVGLSFSAYIIGSVVFSFMLYLVIFVLLYRKKTDDLFLLNPNKYASKKVNDEDAEILLIRLEKMIREKEEYKNADLKLNDLSKALHISGHQLSQLLNDNLGKNFNTYINEFRIEEACKMMISSQLFTLENIGYEVGFNSKSTFFATFRKLKGTTPAAYQQSMLNT